MAPQRAFRIVVTFDTGIKASIWLDEEPVFPASMWDPDTMSCIGHPDGPQIEFLGRELSELVVVRSLPATTGRDSRAHPGLD